MSDENQVRVEITASTGDLERGMQQGAQSVAGASEQMRNSLNGTRSATSGVGQAFTSFLNSVRSSMSGASASAGAETSAIGGHFNTLTGSVGGAVNGLQSQLGSLSSGIGFISKNFAALAAVAAGVGVFKEGINESKKFTGEALGLAKAFNISATEAATLNVALGDIYSSSETAIEASTHLARQLRTNESTLNAMGLKTRETNGEYRNMKDLLLDGAKVLANYKEGTDRALAGQALFGKGAADAGALMKLNNQVLEDAKQKQIDLGLTVTQEGVEAMKAYKASMNDVGDVMSALKKTIGDAVMPIFTKFGQWLSSVGPAAVFILKGAIDGVAAAFWFLKNGVVVVWETINALVVTVAEPIRALAAGIYKAMHGDWSGAKDEIAGIGTTIGSAWTTAMGEIEKSSAETRSKVSDLFNPGTATKATDNSKKKSFVEPPDTKNVKKDDRMKSFEAELLAEKTKYMEENDMREMSLQQEAAFWREKMGIVGPKAKEAGAIQKKIAEAGFADEKRIAKQRTDLLGETADFQVKLALDAIDGEQEASNQRLAMGQQTEMQTIAQEMAFERRRYEIQRKAMQERLELLSKDPSTNLVERQKTLDQLVVMEQKHENDIKKIKHKGETEQAKAARELNAGIASSFKSNIAGMLQGTTTFSGAMKGLFQGILASFANMVAEMATKWIMTLIAGRVEQVAVAVANIMSTAAVGGAAAMASTAAIPIIGPELAPAAGAAMYAGIAAMAPAASARNGFDIPAGLNPVTQLHEKEMVLPAQQADVIRNMADNGGGAGGDTHLHVHAIDAKSVERLFRDNGRHIVTALQTQRRNFAVKA